MLEIVFSENAGGALHIAMGKGKYVGGASAVGIIRSEGGIKDEISKQRMDALLLEWEARHRKGWEEAVPLNGSREDILCFPLALSMGEIDEDGIGEKRKAVFENLASIHPMFAKQVVEELWTTVCGSMEKLLSRAKRGESVRIWYSGMPDDACGICFLMDQFSPLELEQLDVTFVFLPFVAPEGKHAAVSYSDWGEVAPYLWGKFALRGEKVPAEFLFGLKNRWKQLKRENAPLRAVISRQLVSVPKTFYDPFILREIDAQENEFMEAHVVGMVLGRNAFGIGDAFVALRIEEWIRNGMFREVTKAKREDPIYHRVLRKVRL